MKKILSIFLASALLISNLSTVFASDIDNELKNDVHTATLQQIKPVQEGDDYAWMLVTEPGEIASGMGALGLGHGNPEIFGEDTAVVFTQDRIDLQEICEKYDIALPQKEDMSITITYSSEDIDYSNEMSNGTQINDTQIIEEDMLPKTTGNEVGVLSTND